MGDRRQFHQSRHRAGPADRDRHGFDRGHHLGADRLFRDRGVVEHVGFPDGNPAVEAFLAVVGDADPHDDADDAHQPTDPEGLSLFAGVALAIALPPDLL